VSGNFKIKVMDKKEARQFLRNQAANVWAAIRELSMDELQEVRSIAEGYSTTNCWYGECYMKESFLKMIDGRMHDIVALAKEKM
jgi:hypothetical protein